MSSLNQKQGSKLEQLLAQARANIAARTATVEEAKKIEILEQAKEIIDGSERESAKANDGTVWSTEQRRAIELAKNRKSFCIIGKAGTGKTTVAKECVREMQREGIIGPITEPTKYLQSGLPGVAIVSFTNRAVKNIARGMPEDIARHTITIHKLLEFKPEFYDVPDPEKPGETKKIRKFVPGRNAFNPLPASLRLIIMEESSMTDTDLFAKLMAAIPHECQFIFLGDLQQLPPVYGSAILGFKLLELPIVELTRIYRQAAGSPIIDLAWRVSRGDEIKASDFDIINAASGGKLTLRPWKKKLDAEDGLDIMNRLFKQMVDQGVYNPEEDMIMIPFNKQLGCTEFNLNLANHLGKKRKAVVHEIIAGFVKHYFAIGDKVLCDREEAIIEDIMINDNYRGRSPIPPSVNLNRWGLYEVPEDENLKKQDMSMEEVEELMLKALANDKQDEEAKQQASHVLVCRIIDSDEIREVRTTGEYSATGFAYALTVHKCQGSEWRKCFVILHRSHATMISRELVYTAITRAKEELVMIVEPDTFEKARQNQRIKGNTIAEKAEYFKGKKEMMNE
jgi:exodeoxyribonuclease V alpha subunit